MGDGLHHQFPDFDHRHHQQQQQLQLLHQPHPPRPTGAASRRKATSVGEIVEVQGGHIIRSTGRKDRHSKVCTAKGPRDRRVRLSAHTAIQFYDVQDRLGYDRPSKAVDWLIKNAKASIDELAELPPWRPTATTAAAAASDAPPPPDDDTEESDSRKKALSSNGDPSGSAAYLFSSGGAGGDGGRESSFLPPSLESDAIADTIKFFFPLARGGGGAASSSSPPIGFQSYPPDLLSRTNSQSQDLRLSLQSFQDPMLLHSSTTANHHPTSPSAAEQAFFSGSSTPSGFESNAAAWSEQNARMLLWNPSEPSNGSGGGGYLFNLPQAAAIPQGVPMHQLLGQSPVFTQRGPLQSKNSPSIRGWNDPMAAAAAMQQAAAAMSSSLTGFASGNFSGFRIPARIQGEEEQDGVRSKPSSAPQS